MERQEKSDAAARWGFPELPALRSSEIFGQTIRYYDHGEGPPLILIHGLGADADVWAYCLGPLSRSHRVIAPDLLGFGRSSKPLIRYHVWTFVEVLDRLLHDLNLGQVSIVGNSMGGWIAAWFAIRFPERVQRLVLNDAIGIAAGAVDPPVDFRPSSLQSTREVMQFVMGDADLVTDDMIQATYELHLERNDGPTIASIMEAIDARSDSLDDHLGRIIAPTLLLWGDLDRVSPSPVAENFRRMIKGAKLEVIPQCGHIPALEKPQELVRQVLQFLAE